LEKYDEDHRNVIPRQKQKKLPSRKAAFHLFYFQGIVTLDFYE
jgi:hypothetical protein